MGGFFFFQAEDGIRDLVRSRGLGDVYKRQALVQNRIGSAKKAKEEIGFEYKYNLVQGLSKLIADSYTHLTLPTSDLV